LLGAQDGECAELLPKGVQAKAKKALQETWMAEDRASA